MSQVEFRKVAFLLVKQIVITSENGGEHGVESHQQVTPLMRLEWFSF